MLKLFFQLVNDKLVELKDSHGRMNICWANGRINEMGWIPARDGLTNK